MQHFRLYHRIFYSTLANYIAWRVISSLIEHAGVDFRSPRLRFQQTMEGVSDLGATWHLCIERTTQVMGQATGAMFAEKYLSEAGKMRVTFYYQYKRLGVIIK